MVSTNTCSRCGNKIISGARKYQSKFFCAQCYEQVMEEVQHFEEEKQKLVLFIKELFAVQECPELVLYAIDKALKEGKKLSGIKGTLIYYYNIKGNSADNISVIGSVIQREYSNAAQYFEEVKRVKAANQKIDIDVAPIIVQIPERGQNRRKKRRIRRELRSCRRIKEV